MPGVPPSELLAALSLTTDLSSGLPLEEGLGICLVASALATELGLDDNACSDAYYAGLLRAVGCTAHASENAEHFDDDIAFEATLRVLDPGDPAVFAQQMTSFGWWAADDERRRAHAERFARIAPTVGPQAARAGCEVTRSLGARLGLPSSAIVALDDVHERWDGLGIPAGRRGEALTLTGRIVHVAEQAVRAFTDGGRDTAVAEIRRRAGGHLDPDLAAAFERSADAVLAPLDAPDRMSAVLAAAPRPAAVADADRLALGLAIVVDLKGRYLLGHSAHVAVLADAAARLSGMPDPERATVRLAALLHDLGRAAVPSAVWDRPGPLRAGDREQVRLHVYWTERVLSRCPSLSSLAEPAAAHHERLDGSGYHRGIRDTSVAARIVAAADVLAAMTEARAYRPAHSTDAAAREVTRLASSGMLDREAAAAVVEAAGAPQPRFALPADLTEREVDVLRLAARGMSNRAIADQLVISERTVGHHLAHVYDKTGRRTRAGAAVFAIEHGLLPG